MKKKYFKYGLVLISFVILTNSCWFAEGMIQELEYTSVSDTIRMDQVIGAWGAQPVSYGTLNSLEYEVKDSIELIFTRNNSFEFRGYPSGLAIDEKIKKERSFSVEKGSWSVLRNTRKDFVVYLRFARSQVLPNGLSTRYGFYRNNNKLTIMTFLGDPDSGKVITFAKKEE